MKIDNVVAREMLELSALSGFETLSKLSKNEKKTLTDLSKQLQTNRNLEFSRKNLNELQAKLLIRELSPQKKVDLDFILSLNGDLKMNGIDFIDEAFMQILRELPGSPFSSIPKRAEFTQLQKIEFDRLYQDFTVQKYGLNTEPSERVTSIMRELDRFKDELGGAPNFVGEEIHAVNDEDRGKKFLGIPLATVKAWLRQAVLMGYFPHCFWQLVARCFGVHTNNGETRYEYIVQSIKRFDILISNKEKFLLMHQTKEPYFKKLFENSTGLEFHVGANGAESEKNSLELVEHFLTAEFEKAKAGGDEALRAFFAAINGLCYQARYRTIEEYMVAHSANGQVLQVADVDSNSTIQEAFDKEFMSLRQTLNKTPTRQEIFDFFTEKEIFTKEFRKEDVGQAKVTTEDYHLWTIKNLAMGNTEDLYSDEEFLEIEWKILKAASDETPTSDAFKEHVNERLRMISNIPDAFFADDLLQHMEINDEKIDRFFQSKNTQ